MATFTSAAPQPSEGDSENVAPAAHDVTGGDGSTSDESKRATHPYSTGAAAAGTVSPAAVAHDDMMSADDRTSSNAPMVIQAQPLYDAYGNVLPPPEAIELGTNWQTDFCDFCHDTAPTLETIFCPYCQLGFQYHRLRKWYIDMDGLMCAGAFCGDLVMPMGLGMIIATCIVRRRIVERYQIDETQLQSTVHSVACPCSIAQQHREMVKRQEPCGGFCITPPQMYNAPPVMAMSALPHGNAGSSSQRAGAAPPRSHQATSAHHHAGAGAGRPSLSARSSITSDPAARIHAADPVMASPLQPYPSRSRPAAYRDHGY